MLALISTKQTTKGKGRGPGDVFDGAAIFDAGTDEGVGDSLVELLEDLGEGPAYTGSGNGVVLVGSSSRFG